MKKILFTALGAALALAGCGQSATGDSGGGSGGSAQQQLRIVGSSTVYPFTQAVAERFQGANPGIGVVLESTGTGAGLNLFCNGVGGQTPDMANASRRIKESEIERCAGNGVNQVIEVAVGIDGLVLIESTSRPHNFQLTVRDVYAALAANPFGRAQQARSWRDVNPSLPDVPIRVYGPPPTSGTRDSFVELILEKGCDTDPAMQALKTSDSDRHKQVCSQIREDGVFIEAGENDNLLMQRVADNPGSIGVLGYSFLEENRRRVQGIALGGVAPSAATIQNLTYPGARKMFVYVKGEHLATTPAIREFLAEYARGWAPGGYLEQRGLIPLPEAEREAAAQAVQNPRPITAADLR